MPVDEKSEDNLSYSDSSSGDLERQNILVWKCLINSLKSFTEEFLS